MEWENDMCDPLDGGMERRGGGGGGQTEAEIVHDDYYHD